MTHGYNLIARKRDAYSYAVTDNGRVFGFVSQTDVTGTSLWVFVPTVPFQGLRVNADESLRAVLADLGPAYAAFLAERRREAREEDGHVWFD